MKRIVSASLLALGTMFAPAVAQDYDRPPAGFQQDDQGYPSGPGGGAPANAPDPADVAVRVGRLEGRIRDMTGQIEELQNANRKLVQQLQKFQEDVDSRMSSGAARPKHTEADTTTPPVVASGSGPAVDAGNSASARKPRRDDAFDPATASPSDPGRPKPLGSTASILPPDDNSSAPMDLSGGKLRRSDTGSADTLAPTLHLPSATPKSTSGTATAQGTIVANAVPTSPRAEFDAALGLYKGKEYESAEKGFTSFIQKNPKSRLVADATYYLGESFAQRGRSREAAEQYLKISTDFAGSSRAPDAMLHLGMSLKALGAKEQACATFSEVSRKYPNAPAYVKSGAEREAKRSQC